MAADATNMTATSDESGEAATGSSSSADQHHPPEPTDDVVITRHTLSTADGELAYTATAGRIVLKQEMLTDGTFDGHKAKVEMFLVSYVADDVDPATRPVTFAFNGGPGSSSVWLHLGLLGPRRVLAGDAGEPVPPPYRMVENAESLLAHSDLVFIDPMSTGYTRPVSGGKPGDYHGFSADRDAVAEMIRLWTTRNNRWLSPKFLAGESYGTLRAAALAGHLSHRFGMTLNGLMLVSTVLDMGSIVFSDGNDVPFVGYLPTYAALAHFHGLHGDRELQEVIDEARELAERDYPWALARGTRLTDEQRTDIVARVAAVTGLSTDYVDRANLRIEHQRFFAELLRSSGQIIGRLDGRFTGTTPHRNAEKIPTDVSYLAFQAPYTAAANHYLRSDLGYASDLPYEILTDRVHPWSYTEFEGRGVTVVDELDTALRANPFLKVHVSLGYYDGATPFAAAENVIASIQLPDALRDNISYSYYPAGHMMYLHEESRVQQSQDLADFVAAAVVR
ncbi:MAG: peptidase S10 [Actinomycetota bacterium]|nr:peptidase S10 [Actinomycetota bacterium]